MSNDWIVSFGFVELSLALSDLPGISRRGAYASLLSESFTDTFNAGWRDPVLTLAINGLQ
jgi:hypothetical protein